MAFVDTESEDVKTATILSLHERKGKLVWQFRLDSPAGFARDVTVVVVPSRMRSESHHELIVGRNYARDFDPRAGAENYADREEPAQLVVLDAASGTVLCQRRVEASIEYLDWMPATDDDPPMVIYGADSELVTLSMETLQSPN